jgi:small subunit ribosomal protein S9
VPSFVEVGSTAVLAGIPLDSASPPQAGDRAVYSLGGTLSSTVTPITGTKSWFLGTGRRKESIARVFLRAGSGKFTVNGRTAEQYFPNFAWKHDALEPLKFTNLADQVDVVITANGGGVGGQAGAVRMGLARAISRYNPELRPALRTNGFLTRDSRMKERKKYGQKGARKRFQFTKR